MRRLTLLPALALGVIALAGSRLPAPPLPPGTASTGHAIEKHLLDDTDLLVIVSVKDLVKSKFFTRHVQADVEKLLARPEVKPYLKDVGIDLLKDVDQVVVCLGKSCFPDKGPQGGEDGPVILIQGRFDKAKIDAKLAGLAADGKGVKAVEHNKAKFYRLTFGSPRDDGPLVAVLDKNTLLVCGGKEQVVEQMSRVAGKSKPKLKYPAVAAFLKARAKAPNAVDVIALESMVTGLESRGGPGGARARTHRTLGDEGFKQFTVAVKIGEDARGTLRMDVKKAEEVDGKLQEGQKFLAEMKRELDGVPPNAGIDADTVAKMRELIAGIKLKSDKGAVVYEATGTGQQFASILKMYLGLIERFEP